MWYTVKTLLVYRKLTKDKKLKITYIMFYNMQKRLKQL